MRDVARGLCDIHAHGLVHRDIKPANVLLTEQRSLLITDFGAVIRQGKEPDNEQKVVGSPAYMAPEQAGGNPVDGRADLYALGATLFHLLTGRTAAPGTTARETIARLRRGEAALVDTDERTTKPTRNLLAQLLARSPDRRPASAVSVVEAIGEILDGDHSPQAPRTPTHPRHAIPQRSLVTGVTKQQILIFERRRWIAPTRLMVDGMTNAERFSTGLSSSRQTW